VSALLLSFRCLLAVVFAAAGVAKLLDLAGSRQALEEFGVPMPLARLGGFLVPLAEIAVAVALVPAPSARWGAGGALGLLVAFVAGISRARAQGRTPECHCFGQLHSAPAGPATLVRNVILAALAIAVLTAGAGPSLGRGLTSVQVALIVSAAVGTLLALAVTELWFDRRRLRVDLDAATAAARVPGLPRGAAAPEFVLDRVRGSSGSLAELVERRRPTVLIFASTRCGPCLQMLPQLARWQSSLEDSISLAAIFSGEPGEIERLAEEHDLSCVLAQERDEIFELYALRATPSAVLVGPQATIASAPAEGVPAIEALVRSAIAQTGRGQLVVHRG
jgi:uncharacterized membrane protein YphA (DoxX/SURF4 family)/thiol-disulfide isomerase/thioredoxin